VPWQHPGPTSSSYKADPAIPRQQAKGTNVTLTVQLSRCRPAKGVSDQLGLQFALDSPQFTAARSALPLPVQQRVQQQERLSRSGCAAAALDRHRCLACSNDRQ
jgi:hypothetical protein